MSDIINKYNDYLDQHIGNVKKGYKYLKKYLPELFDQVTDLEALDKQIKAHDKSKYSDEEFMPYANYFYGTKSKDVKDAFDYAWLHHQKENPHHWQYWLLIQDEDSDKILDMPYEYIIEMVCDHWAFSWSKGDLYEIFNWYDKNKVDMQLSPYTKKTYESILKKLKTYLDDFEYDKK